MATTRTNVGERMALRRKPTRTQTFVEHALDVRNKNPDPFEDWSSRDIARALFKAGVLEHENVALFVLERCVQLARRDLDPNFDDVISRRTSTAPLTVPKKSDLVTSVLGDLNARTVMRDGRRLGDWTIGEFRKEFRGMSVLFSQFEGLDDDELVSDHLK